MRILEFAASKKRKPNWDGIRDVPMPGCIVHDLTKLPIPTIKDNTYDGVYSEHFIEHLERHDGVNLFKECLRILKPGGIIRTVWPSAEAIEWLRSDQDLSNHPFVAKYHSRYVVRDTFCPPKYRNLRIQDQVAEGIIWQKGEHKHIWSTKEMINELSNIGYTNVIECEYGKSNFPEFNNIEKFDGMRECHSSVIEATKV